MQFIENLFMFVEQDYQREISKTNFNDKEATQGIT